MKRITTHIILLFLLLSSTLWAQNEKKLTLEEAIKLGLDQSRQMKLSEGRVAAGNARLAQYKAQLIPFVGVYGNYTRISNNITPLSANLSSIIPGETAFVFNPQILNQYNFTGSIKENIFQGFKVHYGIQSAEYLKRATELDYDNDKAAVILNIVSAYYNLYIVRESLKLVEENIQLVSERVKETQKMVDQGVATQNDLTRNQLQLSNFNLSKIDVSNNIDVANYNMTIMLGLSPDTQIVPDSANIGQAKELQQVNDYQESALKNRPDLKANDYRKLLSLSNIKLAKSGFYPVLSAGFDYMEVDPSLRVFPETDVVYGTWDLGATITFNITGAYATRHQVQEANAMLLQTQAQNDMQLDNVKMEVNQGYVTYKVALDRIKVSAESVDQAESNSRDMESKFRNGTALTTDILDADVLLLQAKLNLLNAKADAEIAYQQLLRATGENLK